MNDSQEQKIKVEKSHAPNLEEYGQLVHRFDLNIKDISKLIDRLNEHESRSASKVVAKFIAEYNDLKTELYNNIFITSDIEIATKDKKNVSEIQLLLQKLEKAINDIVSNSYNSSITEKIKPLAIIFSELLQRYNIICERIEGDYFTAPKIKVKSELSNDKSEDLQKDHPVFEDWYKKKIYDLERVAITYQEDARTITNDFKNFKNIEFKEIENNFKNHNEKIRDSLVQFERKLERIKYNFENRLEQLLSSVKESENEINEKRKRIDEILHIATSRTIAGSYDESASEEKAIANYLRYASLLIMAVMIVIVGYSIWESTTSTFDINRIGFRIGLIFLLSLPSAYLARESAKHRQQHYNHLQTSLSLKTIDPYLLSLPEEKRFKIKEEIASKLFIQRDYSHVGNDPYPLNIQEILLEIIKRADFKPKPDTTKDKAK